MMHDIGPTPAGQGSAPFAAKQRETASGGVASLTPEQSPQQGDAAPQRFALTNFNSSISFQVLQR
jgi:hypothetical protein